MSQGVRISPRFLKIPTNQVLFRPSETTLQPLGLQRQSLKLARIWDLYHTFKICVLVKVLVNVSLQCWIPSHCLLCCDHFLLFFSAWIWPLNTLAWQTQIRFLFWPAGGGGSLRIFNEGAPAQWRLDVIKLDEWSPQINRRPSVNWCVCPLARSA